MALRTHRPGTPSRRFMSSFDFSEITKSTPEKSLVSRRKESGGRNNQGRATNINRGGGHKQLLRQVDFKRQKIGVPATVIAVEYDPNRTARIALIAYADGEKSYIICPNGLQIGQVISSGVNAEVKPGNVLPLKAIPTGEAIHNIELKVGKGGQIVRSAGSSAQLLAKEGEYGLLRLPSGEIRKVLLDCTATIGTVSNVDKKNLSIGKAGRARWMGRRPHVRGVAKNPVDHPMGGGEGRSSGGRHPCSPNGLPAKGYKTRKNKRTQRFIVTKNSNKNKR